MNQRVPLESEEGETLVAYLRLRGHKFTHIPNETGGSLEARRRAIRMMRQGTSKGFVDYLVIVNDRLIGIELKRVRGSKTSLEQHEWVSALNAAGIPTTVAKGAGEAIAFVQKFE